MQVGVGHLEAGDGQARARHAECRFLGETNRARHLHEVRRDVRGGIGPRLIGAARDDQDMPGRGGFNRGEREAQVVAHTKRPGQTPEMMFSKTVLMRLLSPICARFGGRAHPATRAGVNYPGEEYC